MKKNYVAPQTECVELEIENLLLAESNNESLDAPVIDNVEANSKPHSFDAWEWYE